MFNSKNFSLIVFQKVFKILILSIFILSTWILTTSSKALAFGENRALDIEIVVDSLDSDKARLSYYILQDFREESRGIFLSLPKNQNGVWTEYEILSVERSKFGESPEKLNYQDNNILYDKNWSFQPEPYDQIQEWNQFRLRVGKSDRKFQNQTYLYKIDIELSLDTKNYNYDLVLLRDWKDPIGQKQVYLDGENICTKTANCSSNRIFLDLPSQADKPGWFWNLWLSYYPYLVLFVILYFPLFYIFKTRFWQKGRFQKVKKPEFYPPKEILPWQSEFFLDDNQMSLKNTLLAYLFWLNHKKYIKIQPITQDTEVISKRKDKIEILILRELPEKINSKFDHTINQIAKFGFKKGIKKAKFASSEIDKCRQVFKSQLAAFYNRKPIFPLIFVLPIASIILGIIIRNIFLDSIFKSLLIGDSYLNLVMYVFIIIIPGLLVLGYYYEQYSRQGLEVLTHLKKYKYYLENVEKESLDFSNNPAEGVAYYLESLSYAAGFGILKQFNKYMSKLGLDEKEIENYNHLSTAVWGTSLYSSGGSGRGFSSVSSGGFSGGGGSW